MAGSYLVQFKVNGEEKEEEKESKPAAKSRERFTNWNQWKYTVGDKK